MTSTVPAPTQFSVASHYNAMVELDSVVHDNRDLSLAEANKAISLIKGRLGRIPTSVFLPCFGTGRHIPTLLLAGVTRVVGVDLSDKCVDKARKTLGSDPRVELVVVDLATWRTREKFDCVILLGNSFGDIIDDELLLQVTRGMVAPLHPDGTFLMDYIGQGYLDRCRAGRTTVWDGTINGRKVNDHRTPCFNPTAGVMTISVKALDAETDELVWDGAYQKRILDDRSLASHFAHCGVRLERAGVAHQIMPDYYGEHHREMGMIGRSSWWIGQK